MFIGQGGEKGHQSLLYFTFEGGPPPSIHVLSHISLLLLLLSSSYLLPPCFYIKLFLLHHLIILILYIFILIHHLFVLLLDLFVFAISLLHQLHAEKSSINYSCTFSCGVCKLLIYFVLFFSFASSSPDPSTIILYLYSIPLS